MEILSDYIHVPPITPYDIGAQFAQNSEMISYTSLAHAEIRCRCTMRNRSVCDEMEQTTLVGLPINLEGMFTASGDEKSLEHKINSKSILKSSFHV